MVSERQEPSRVVLEVRLSAPVFVPPLMPIPEGLAFELGVGELSCPIEGRAGRDRKVLGAPCKGGPQALSNRHSELLSFLVEIAHELVLGLDAAGFSLPRGDEMVVEMPTGRRHLNGVRS